MVGIGGKLNFIILGEPEYDFEPAPENPLTPKLTAELAPLIIILWKASPFLTPTFSLNDILWPAILIVFIV